MLVNNAITIYQGNSPILMVYQGNTVIWQKNNARIVSEIYYNASNDCIIEIPVYSSNNLKFRVKGKWKGSTGGIVVGSNMQDDNNDYRFFNYSDNYYLDIGNIRSQTSYQIVIDEEIDITIGNRYIYNNKTQSYIINDLPFEGSLVRDKMKWYLNYLSLMEWQCWEENTLIFDGKAAEANGQGGILNTITNLFYTNYSHQISYNE